MQRSRLGENDWRAAPRKRTWGAGREPAEHGPAVCPGGQEGQRHPDLDQKWCGQQEQGRDRAPVLGTGEASLQAGHGGAGACPEQDSEAGEGSGEQVR